MSSLLSPPAKADTLTGVFSNPVLAGYAVESTGLVYFDNTGTAVVGTSTPAGSSCAGSNMLCWGTAPDLGIPASQQYSELTFSGSTHFNGTSPLNQFVGTISYSNGTSDSGTTIFGATLSFFDNGVAVGSDNVIITTTGNQYAGTGLSPAQLATDADYINICGNDSNICNSSIEAFEAGEGGTGLLVDLNGNLVGDPTLILNGVSKDPSQAGCATCGTVGMEPALGETPEPSSLILLSTGLFSLLVLARRSRRTALIHTV